MISQSQNTDGRAVAIIGLAGRFPGADSVSKYWQNLCDGVESISTASDDELLDAGVERTQLSNPDYVRAGGVIQNADQFDASFFGFGAREAEIIDPQQRIFLECAWDVFEDAGHDPAKFDGSIGVFAGCGLNTYSLIHLFPNSEVMASVGPYQIMLGNDKDFLATRVSYKLNLKGPAVNVQTACSTSLVAVQMAYESILRGESDMALAGGVSIHFPQKSGYLYMPGMILSPDGHCRAFDAKAAGTVPGRGAGVVLLKPLEKAIEDNDKIYAVIRGAAINNDGASKIGYSAPSVEGQRRVIVQSMKMADFTPETVHYIEAHGTGTEVGDPIEVTALTEAFREGTDKNSFCVIGSVKPNIGHLDTAAGIAGLIKAALAIHHRTIPPTLHFGRPNPHIHFAETPFYVNTELQRYNGDEPFRAGVSSFGIGGTNAHVSLEEAPRFASSALGSPQLIVLSAKSKEALDARAANLVEFLKDNEEQNLNDIAYTLQEGRRAFPYRRSVVAQSTQDLCQVLSSRNSPRIRNGDVRGDNSKVAFLFPGQGAQHINMGLGLYHSIPVFRETVAECADLLKPHLQLDLRTLLYPTEEDAEKAENLLNQTWITQPALFTIEYAMAKTWMYYGIHPAAMLGHSVGEYVAACIAGVFSHQDALILLAKRGSLVYSLEPGTMLAVSLSTSELIPLLSEGLSIAGENSPRQCVASGPVEEIDALEKVLVSRQIECRRLRTSHAFHSQTLDPIVSTFVEQCGHVSFRPPEIPFLSNLTGTWITPEQATDPTYWGAHLRNTVQFSSCLKQLSTIPGCTFLEVGPAEILLTFARQHLDIGTSHPLIPSMRQAKSKQDDYELWLTNLGRLWLTGIEPNWKVLHSDTRPRRVSLPTYPFERQRYWIQPIAKQNSSSTSSASPLIKKTDVADWFYVPSWKRTLPQLLSSSEALGENDVWLVLESESGKFTHHLFHENNKLGRKVSVKCGDDFRLLSKDCYQISPDNRDDWEALFQHLLADDLWPARILYTWADASQAFEANDDASLDRIFLSLMFLAQTISKISSSRAVQINIATEQSCSVTGEKISQLAAASLPILCKVISLECPNISCRLIDLDPNQHAVATLERELLSDASGQTVVYRGSTRWIDTYEPVQLENDFPKTIHLTDQGTYLITGGLGGLGLTFAQYLARTVRAHLLLTTRSKFPPETEWEMLLQAETTPAPLKERIRGLKSIINAGGTVAVVEADTCDLSRMREVVAECRSLRGALHGIIHAAGLPSMSMIQSKSRVEAIATLSPKTTGMRWIAECLGSENLQFVLLCSSISAIVPSYGLADYATANAYLDAFANAFDEKTNTRVISVNWDTWRDVGMAANLSGLREISGADESVLDHAITTKDGEAVFERILRCPVSQIIVSTRDLGALQDLAQLAISRTDQDELINFTKSAASIHPRPEMSQAYAEPVNEMEQAVVEIWKELLGVDRIGRHDNFFELGGHSLLGTQVIARIRNRFALDLPLRTVFEAPTPAELAETLTAIPWASGANTATPLLSLEREEIEL